jgi:hypothetical protein
MNLLNRILVILICLALIIGAVAVAVLAWTIPQDTINSLRDAVNWLQDHNQDEEKALLTAIVVLIAFLALVYGLLQLLPPNSADVKVTDLQVGDAVLSTAAIGQRVEEAVRLVPNVAEVRATVRPKRKGVVVSLDLHVDPDANLAVVTDEACMAAQDVLTERVHVALAEPPRARLHYRELRLRRPESEPPPSLRTQAPAAYEPEDAVEPPPEPAAMATEEEAIATDEGVEPAETQEEQPPTATDETTGEQRENVAETERRTDA